MKFHSKHILAGLALFLTVESHKAKAESVKVAILGGGIAGGESTAYVA